jgi:hypothetical protein
MGSLARVLRDLTSVPQAVFALVLDIWEIVALADSTGRRKRLSAVYLAVSELVAAAACVLWVFLAIHRQHQGARLQHGCADAGLRHPLWCFAEGV